MFRTAKFRFFIALLGGVMLVGLPAHADFAVGVSVEAGVPGFKAEYGQKLNNVLDQLRFQIIQFLKTTDAFRYWNFTAADADSRIRVIFRVTEPQRNVIQMEMEYTPEPGISNRWTTTWMKPADLDMIGYPSLESAAGDMAQEFEQKLLTPKAEELKSLLQKSAPLSSGGKWDSHFADLRIILPLRWDRYSSLRKSDFRILCSWPQRRASADLRSHAFGSSARYEDVH